MTAAEAAQHFVHKGHDPNRNAALNQHIQKLWQSGSASVFECRVCGFGFAWPFTAGDAAFYNLAYPYATYPKSKWEFLRTLDVLATLETKGKTALEVGAGRGHFLDLLHQRRLLRLCDVSAIEYNNDALPILAAKGVTTFSHDIRSADFADKQGTFDFIFMFQVVEHMDDVDALFKRVQTLLKPHGSLFIAVPNKTRTDYQERHGSQLDMPPNHIGRWTPDAFRAICDRHGLTVQAVEFEPFDAGGFLLQDIAYSFVRRAQTSSGLSGFVRSLPRSKLSRLAQGAVAGMLFPTRLAAWREAFANRGVMGGSLWMQARREQPDHEPNSARSV
ncbi:MAG: class I SAM-dependent methyltransferase [Beijerinckiaceae bacterium]|nr:class I SAM-dependent methyltransferase [Beijerinckiaceae bacterium]